jgi:hypothetical protein
MKLSIMFVKVENGARLSVVLNLRKKLREVVLTSNEQYYRCWLIGTLISGREVNDSVETISLVQDAGAYCAAFYSIAEEFPLIAKRG